jgi:hypothetical protein
LIGVLVLIFVLAFTGSAVQKVVRDFKNTAPHWGKIKYSERRRHISSYRHIPRDATIILLGYPNTKDYYFFGEDYTRRVIQWPTSLDESNLEDLIDKYPGSFVYIDAQRCDPGDLNHNREWVNINNPSFTYLWGQCKPESILRNRPEVQEISWGKEDSLFLLPPKE